MTDHIRKTILLSLLITLVLFVNLPILYLNWMYPEEPLIYVANQQIHHFSDLLNVYLHPKLFHPAIAFFRPSGHFLMYQLITPFIGWHQTKILLAINFVFFALTGYYLIRLYHLLFSGYWVGGLIGFAIYMSHPSLFLVKIIALHFEFAHTFFIALGLYYFVLFSQKNEKNVAPLVLAVFFYVIAVTFKETALMAGLVYILYLLVHLYQGESLSIYFRRIIRDKQTIELIAFLGITIVTIALYVSSALTASNHLQSQAFTAKGMLICLNGFIHSIFNWHLANAETYQQIYFGAQTYFSSMMQIIMLTAVIFTLSTAVLLFTNKSTIAFKKSFVFLALAVLCFLSMPLCWGLGYPWHFNLALMMLSLLFGFSIEYIFHQFYQNKFRINVVGTIIAIGIGLTSFNTNTAQAKHLSQNLPPLYNAITKPPMLANLTKNSLIIVEDSIVKNAYALGAAAYPCRLFFMFMPQGYIYHSLYLTNFYLPIHPDFAGSLFKMAYLNADIKEQVVPFQVDHLEQVPTSLLYQWLQHYENSYYLTYDQEGNWHDLTNKFKHNLLAEKEKRKLQVRNYLHGVFKQTNQQFIRTVLLPGDQETDCQYFCDTEKKCVSYRFKKDKFASQCKMYRR